MADFAYQILFDGEPAEDEFYADLVELTIDVRSADAATATMRLATSLDDDGEWLHLNDESLALFSRIEIKLGYLEGEGLAGALGGALGGGGNDGMIPVFTGYVSGADLKLSSTPGQTFFDVLMVDTSVLLGLEEKVVVWSDLSDSDVVDQIAGEYADSTDVGSTQAVHEANENVLVQRATDLQFVHMLARRNGLEFAFETDVDSGDVVAVCKAPQLDGTPQPDLAIQFGSESNLVSFGAKVDGRRPLNVKVTQTAMHAKTPNSAQIPDVSLDLLGADDLVALVGNRIDALASPQEATAQLLILGPSTSDATALNTMAQAARDEAGWFMTANGEINCDAYGTVLQPRRTVLVKGAGELYSGKYYVTRVTHKLTSDGRYRQTFEAKRNALGLDGTEQFGGNGLGLPLPGL
jgi:phage protein D